MLLFVKLALPEQIVDRFVVLCYFAVSDIEQGK